MGGGRSIARGRSSGDADGIAGGLPVPAGAGVIGTVRQPTGGSVARHCGWAGVVVRRYGCSNDGCDLWGNFDGPVLQRTRGPGALPCGRRAAGGTALAGARDWGGNGWDDGGVAARFASGECRLRVLGYLTRLLSSSGRALRSL